MIVKYFIILLMKCVFYFAGELNIMNDNFKSVFRPNENRIKYCYKIKCKVINSNVLNCPGSNAIKIHR